MQIKCRLLCSGAAHTKQVNFIDNDTVLKTKVYMLLFSSFSQCPPSTQSPNNDRGGPTQSAAGLPGHHAQSRVLVQYHGHTAGDRRKCPEETGDPAACRRYCRLQDMCHSPDTTEERQTVSRVSFHYM